jgi:hypothetical protein
MAVRCAGLPQSLLSLHAGGMGRGQLPQQQQQPQPQGLPFGGAGPQPGSGNALLQLLQGRGAIGASGLPPALSRPQPQVTPRSLWLPHRCLLVWQVARPYGLLQAESRQ